MELRGTEVTFTWGQMAQVEVEGVAAGMRVGGGVQVVEADVIMTGRWLAGGRRVGGCKPRISRCCKWITAGAGVIINRHS